jgi:hypothetical protein
MIIGECESFERIGWKMRIDVLSFYHIFVHASCVRTRMAVTNGEKKKAMLYIDSWGHSVRRVGVFLAHRGTIHSCVKTRFLAFLLSSHSALHRPPLLS